MGISTTRTLGMAARVLGKHVGRTRTFRALKQASRAMAVHFGGVLHQLWLEITGFVFLALSAVGVFALIHEWSKYQASRTNPDRVVLAICFTLMFGWFGLSSFWRVRKKG